MYILVPFVGVSLLIGSVGGIYYCRKRQIGKAEGFKKIGEDPNGDEDDDITLNISTQVIIESSQVEVKDRIGTGSFAEVYKGTWCQTVVAVKMLRSALSKDRASFIQEASIMLQLRHPNVVKNMGVVVTPRLCIITEYLARGDMTQLLLNKDYVIEPEHLRRMIVDACRGMTYLHAANIIHRDLKCKNLLIDKDWNVKVADFGLARFIEKAGHMTSCGTPTHVAPEIIRKDTYTTKADVYSFGVCLWEMVTRDEVYPNIAPFQIIVSVATKNLRPVIPTDISKELAELIQRCWDDNPKERYDFKDLVEVFEEMKCPEPLYDAPYEEIITTHTPSSIEMIHSDNKMSDTSL